MINDEIVLSILETASEDAKKNIKHKKTLDINDAIPIILKGLYNHIAHLDAQMVTKAEFNRIEDRFSGIVTKVEFNILTWAVGIGFTVLGLMMGFSVYLNIG